MQKQIEKTKRELNRKINNFNHILEREITDREIKEIGKLEEELGYYKEKQREELIK